MRPILSMALCCISLVAAVARAADFPDPIEADYGIQNFRFESGEVLPELRLHYRTIGKLNPEGNNAVLILHGTGGTGAGFLSNQYAGVLFGPGQLLDAARYFIILPDNIGHGKSSKPSDGLRAKFPHYGYRDMVLSQYRLVREKLGVCRLRLVTGTSMGGMHTWLWGEMYPDFMDALMPLASLPVEIAGRNRMMRRMVIDPIRNDPEWNNGDYKTQPVRGLTTAMYTVLFMTSVPRQMHKLYPTRDIADAAFDKMIRGRLQSADANDTLYQYDASRDYNPEPELEKIQTPLVAINSADDQVNPPELDVMEKQIRRVKNGRYVLIPISDETRGHGTHSLPALWKEHLSLLLRESERPDDNTDR
jgi:homoserine O-acetyltransferase/O-succinyltransferase